MNPEITIFANNLRNNYRAVLNEDASRHFDTEDIVFNMLELSIRFPSLEDKKTYRLSKNGGAKYKGKNYPVKTKRFSFTYYGDDDILGKYSLEKDEDTYFLIKQNGSETTSRVRDKKYFRFY